MSNQPHALFKKLLIQTTPQFPDLDSVQRALEKEGVDHAKKLQPTDLLFLAVYNDLHAAIPRLIQLNADIQVKHPESNVTLLQAATMVHTPLAYLELLIELGLNPEDKDPSLNNNLIQMLLIGEQKIKNLDILYQCVDFFLEKGIDVNHQDKYGFTVLMDALRNPDLHPMVPFLLKKGASTTLFSQNEQSLFHIIEGAPHERRFLVNILMEYGANPAVVNKYGNVFVDQPSIYEGSFLEVNEWFNSLVEKGLNPNHRNNAGKSLLEEAVWCESVEMVKILLNQPLIDINSKNKEGHDVFEHFKYYQPSTRNPLIEEIRGLLYAHLEKQNLTQVIPKSTRTKFGVRL